MLAVLAPAPALPLAVRKNYQAGMMTILNLTFLSNVVAYACRPSSTKNRHDVHQHRLSNRRGAIAGRSR
jgi:hypothetical protein